MIVVADTSVLINLCAVRHGDLVCRLFREVLIPPEVASEFARLAASVPRFSGLKLPVGIRLQAAASPVPAVQAKAGLDPGEAAALSLAVEIHADAVLVDERRGYEVAIQLGLRAIGLLGLLLQAKSIGIVPAVRPVLDALRHDAGFWLSERLREQVLKIAGEAA
ncbi:MAG: DUF3368 domain-containing protein [Verrucomicrobiales bacterium]|nr:DUF3368 domain-containing protein [Verrucomicrobiales bacterium]